MFYLFEWKPGKSLKTGFYSMWDSLSRLQKITTFGSFVSKPGFVLWQNRILDTSDSFREKNWTRTYSVGYGIFIHLPCWVRHFSQLTVYGTPFHSTYRVGYGISRFERERYIAGRWKTIQFEGWVSKQRSRWWISSVRIWNIHWNIDMMKMNRQWFP